MKPVMNNMSVVVSRVLQSVMRYFNPFMRLVLASRAHRMMSGQLMLVSFTGRRTGRSYTTPSATSARAQTYSCQEGHLVEKPDERHRKGCACKGRGTW